MTVPKIKKTFETCGLHPFNADKPGHLKLTLHEVHSADARIFEGVLQDGYVEMGGGGGRFYNAGRC